jgi:hypothetical protein
MAAFGMGGFGPQWRNKQQVESDVVVEHPRKDAVDTDVKDMSQSCIILEYRRLGSLYPDQIAKEKPFELFETCADQWGDLQMTPKTRKFIEDMVRKLQCHDRWMRKQR